MGARGTLAATGVLADPSTAFRLEAGCLLATIVTVASIALVLPPNGSGWLARLLRHPALLSTGKYSYTIYVVHFEIGEQFHAYVRHHVPNAHPTMLLAAYVPVVFTLSWTVAWISWQVLEKPMLSLKRFVPMPRPVTASARPMGRGCLASE
jgi:peptidoglycan/LPS O-acetylase OafA/YrhL